MQNIIKMVETKHDIFYELTLESDCFSTQISKQAT